MVEVTEIPADDALRIDALRVEDTNGEVFDISYVVNNGVDDDAYVDGRYGGTTTEYEAEGGLVGEDLTVGFSIQVEIPRNRDVAVVQIYEKEVYRGQERRVEIEELEITEKRDEPYEPYNAY